MYPDPVRELVQNYFFREPEWRWLRASHLDSENLPIDSRIDDKWVIAAHSAITESRGSNSSVASIQEAQRIWSGDLARRARLEAWLLTTETLDEVARRCGLEAAVVEAFAELFFDVRSKRQASDWIAHHAIGSLPGGGFKGTPLYGVWKATGYSGGTFALEAVLEFTFGVSDWEREALGPIQGSADRDPRAEFRKRKILIFVATHTAESDEDFVRVVETIRELRVLEETITGIPQFIDTGLRIAEEFLMAIPRLKAERDAKEESQKQQRKKNVKKPDAGANRYPAGHIYSDRLNLPKRRRRGG